jgi:hypothetical protein
MAREPKLMDHPGVPGKVREQHLDEYMQALSSDHLAREELADIRAMALSGMKAINELVFANEKIRDLEKRIAELSPPVLPSSPAQAQELDLPEVGSPEHNAQYEAGGKFARVKCPHCTELVSTNPFAWHKHQKDKHNLNAVPIPR